MAQSGSNKKASHGLVAVSCAAVMAVYTAGFARTRSAAEQFDAQEAARRPAAQGPQTGDASAEVQAAEPLAREEARSRVARRPNPAQRTVAEATVPERTIAPPYSNTPATPVAESSPASAVAPLPTEASVAPVAAATAAPAAANVVVPPVVAAPAAVVAPTAPVTPPPPPAPPAPKWKDGKYTGWGTSRHGDIQAEVVIENGRILGATIAQCLTRYSCDVIDMLPPQVAQRQSGEVDYVSRATESADAFYFAVAEALGKAK